MKANGFEQLPIELREMTISYVSRQRFSMGVFLFVSLRFEAGPLTHYTVGYEAN